jgi:2-oxoglutarate dehydrogenase complex dehydrogenase (E1) component-like enzyme
VRRRAADRCEQEIHSRLQRHVKSRLQSIEKGAGLDWATAEVLLSDSR